VFHYNEQKNEFIMATSKQCIIISKVHIIVETKQGFLVRNLVGLDPFWYSKQ